MVMSGWAKQDKQPWVFGEPYTSINRKYLRLKMKLTPYMYTLMHEANTSGTPAVRGLVLEYPGDPQTRDSSTQYEYLLGKSLLVAPVWKDEEKRDSIYLPEGQWIDYWDGKTYAGHQWINKYPAPLDKLPLFVRSGSIIPQYPEMDFDGQRPADTLTLDIYPAKSDIFNLYEDDGKTREYRKGKWSVTQISCRQDEGSIRIVIDSTSGAYTGMPANRNYQLEIHTLRKPRTVLINGLRIANAHISRKAGRSDILLISCGRWDLRKRVNVLLRS
jgi:alpha-glucosidase (family GH31 glycosyl hydrolase)